MPSSDTPLPGNNNDPPPPSRRETKPIELLDRENDDRHYSGPVPFQERPPPVCHIFRLPLELRAMIWAYVLGKNHPIKVYTQRRRVSATPEMRLSTKPRRSGSRSIALEPALASVCREIRVETLGTSYTKNTFWTQNTFKLIIAEKNSPAVLLARRREKPFIRAVILSFDITYTLRGGGDTQQSQHTAELGVTIDADGKATFSTFVWLDQECACQLIGIMSKYLHMRRESVARTGLLRFAIDFGPWLCFRYTRSTVRWADTWGVPCEKCGKKVWTG
ncbi:hypothetical protein LTR91_019286 [Friedmanniomyces endolithicus]|uniref:2EXR domain-containing protein n=1 Tax=Friedmanniomyces endolithicus TaxID=329885 RepID=A0AAN6HAX9_9PEZI|nr:hypothetical protein LTR38_016093 [Friedmanniomyces endolithicus]KAK0793740.1 hypothetical protein LTR59_008106 [Friedmanniomyces endolithicus]KAK0856652.1 hypothetical protein LTS02_010556 [Friedmanniomyces endolithicus]KAK0882460.1 hypothetical protein LTR87_003755 [Friedmanniomyces endolithicus]KAK0889366.1 hypothetical protein LTR02_015515 [Friedmanniomyces endolithicus]